MFGFGFGELLLVFLIALIFIGPKKLPELAKGLGQGIKEFQKAAKGLSDQLQDTENQPHDPPKAITKETDNASSQSTAASAEQKPEKKEDTQST